jgi:hypothetical protein
MQRQLPESVLNIAVRRCGMLHYRVPDANRRASCPWPCSSGLQARATPSPARTILEAGAPSTKAKPDLLPPPFVSHRVLDVPRASLFPASVRDLSLLLSRAAHCACRSRRRRLRRPLDSSRPRHLGLPGISVQSRRTLLLRARRTSTVPARIRFAAVRGWLVGSMPACLLWRDSGL